MIEVLLNPKALWHLLREYFDIRRINRVIPIQSRESLQEFLNTRASFVAQTSLYGYLRTRAGMRYPELFDDDAFVHSINIAKWQMWLACLSDLTVFTGGLLLQHPQAKTETISALMQKLVDDILDETGIPAEAGDTFSKNAEGVRSRIALCDWQKVTDDETPFSHSPRALVKWAPIVDELKQLDEEIVTNSVRFRWQKVRHDLRVAVDTAAVLESLTSEQ